MCGRFTQYNYGRLINAIGELPFIGERVPRYNVAPTQRVLALRLGKDGGKELVWLRWGLIPAWAKDASIATHTFNVRGDTVHEKPAFRSAFVSRRCLIPVDGFFEWKKGTGKKKTPYFIERSDGEPMVFAGIWDSWVDPEGEVIESCSIITTDATELLRPLHTRMPVILEKAHFDRWLSATRSDLDELRGLLKPFPSERLKLHPVSELVNSARNEGAGLIAPVAEQAAERTLFD